MKAHGDDSFVLATRAAMVATFVGFKSLNFRHFWRITIVLRVKRGRRRPFLELPPCNVMMLSCHHT